MSLEPHQASPSQWVWCSMALCGNWGVLLSIFGSSYIILFPSDSTIDIGSGIVHRGSGSQPGGGFRSYRRGAWAVTILFIDQINCPQLEDAKHCAGLVVMTPWRTQYALCLIRLSFKSSSLQIYCWTLNYYGPKLLLGVDTEHCTYREKICFLNNALNWVLWKTNNPFIGS